jgi:hypothetical protein
MSLLKKNLNLITNYFKKICKDENKVESNLSYGYNKDTGNWHCIECGENMGDNPRQLCGKSMCMNKIYDNDYNDYDNIV